MSNSVYKLIDLVGVSEQSWEDAASSAIEKAAETLKDLRIAEVRKMDVKIEQGKPMQFRTNLRVSFKYKD
jgi:flavin-binding protein dodecin